MSGGKPPFLTAQISVESRLKEVEAAARQRQAEAYRTFGGADERAGASHPSRLRRLDLSLD